MPFPPIRQFNPFVSKSRQEEMFRHLGNVKWRGINNIRNMKCVSYFHHHFTSSSAFLRKTFPAELLCRFFFPRMRRQWDAEWLEPFIIPFCFLSIVRLMPGFLVNDVEWCSWIAFEELLCHGNLCLRMDLDAHGLNMLLKASSSTTRFFIFAVASCNMSSMLKQVFCLWR